MLERPQRTGGRQRTGNDLQCTLIAHRLDMSPGSDLPSWLAPVCLSPIIGSFVGVLIRRLPAGKSAAWSRSQCEACDRILSPIELLPIASYVALRGRCRACGAAIAPFHLIIELASIVVACWAATVNQDATWLWTACILGWALLALAWIDAEHMRLPDVLTLPLLAAGIGAQTLIAPERLSESVLGALAGYLGFQGVALAYRAIRGREGLGAGDAKLLAAGGAWVGWQALPDLIVLAALFAILAVVIQRIRGGSIDRSAAIPFGPFLALSLWMTYLYGPLLFDSL
jgi:leader peptidase (prepilin peptidase) / N-methyltransferase